MPLQPISHADHERVLKLARELRRGDGMTPERMRELIAEWEPIVAPDRKETAENYVVTSPDGTTTGVVGPRWMFHLFGLRHRAVEIGLTTPTGLIVLQRRSDDKPDWPGAWDMAVAGHVPQNPDGSDMDLIAAAWKEIEEEIGLAENNAKITLAEGHLTPVGECYNSFDRIERTPLLLNAEVRQIYAATLTGDGMARLHFADAEASGLLFVPPDVAWQMLAGPNVASGMRYSLPRLLDHLEKQNN